MANTFASSDLKTIHEAGEVHHERRSLSTTIRSFAFANNEVLGMVSGGTAAQVIAERSNVA
ncbi:hypothetical protein WG66_014188 [Moniliophthora roreri]|uniref:Uncharacterized protein n=1 Tax=Moniliophthora roreri TaxID=221103 RepID=A0A0W0GFR1_MONRR|nr:hypothetical protein WG66_014188 [Moniliophthora roreri]